MINTLPSRANQLMRIRAISNWLITRLTNGTHGIRRIIHSQCLIVRCKSAASSSWLDIFSRIHHSEEKLSRLCCAFPFADSSMYQQFFHQCVSYLINSTLKQSERKRPQPCAECYKTLAPNDRTLSVLLRYDTETARKIIADTN